MNTNGKSKKGSEALGTLDRTVDPSAQSPMVAHRTLGRGVHGSILVRGVVCCGLEHVTFPKLNMYIQYVLYVLS